MAYSCKSATLGWSLFLLLVLLLCLGGNNPTKADVHQQGRCTYDLKNATINDDDPVNYEFLERLIRKGHDVRMGCNGGSMRDAWLLPELKEVFFYDMKMPILDRKSFFRTDYETTMEIVAWKNSGIQELREMPYYNAEMVDFSMNEIRTLPENLFERAVNLRKLDLSANRIESLPATLLMRTTLMTELNLSGNMIVEIPNKFLFFTMKLERLLLNDNKIKQLDPNVFTYQTSLTEITLHHNGLTSLDDKIFRLQDRLEKLELNDNFLTEIPAAIFKRNRNLQVLRLDGNILTVLDNDLFSEQALLQVLDLSRNPLIVIPDGFLRQTSNMSVLLLSKLSVNDFSPAILNGLHGLTTLSLADNPGLCWLEDNIFLRTPNLKTLDLSRTTLPRVPSSVMDLNQLTDFSVQGNPMPCDCDNQWFVMWASDPDTYATVIADDVTCANGKNILDVLSRLKCKPVIVYASQDRVLKPEDSTKITCKAFGFPEPVVTLITPSGRSYYWSDSDETPKSGNQLTSPYTLVISSMTSHDCGKYKWLVENEYGNTTAETGVYLRPLGKRLPPDPEEVFSPVYIMLCVFFLTETVVHITEIVLLLWDRDEKFVKPYKRLAISANIFPYFKMALFCGLRYIKRVHSKQKDQIRLQAKNRILNLIRRYRAKLANLSESEDKEKAKSDIKDEFRRKLTDIGEDIWAKWKEAMEAAKEKYLPLQELLTKTDADIFADEEQKLTLLDGPCFNLIEMMKLNCEYFEKFNINLVKLEDDAYDEDTDSIEKEFDFWFCGEQVDWMLDNGALQIFNYNEKIGVQAEDSSDDGDEDEDDD